MTFSNSRAPLLPSSLNLPAYMSVPPTANRPQSLRLLIGSSSNVQGIPSVSVSPSPFSSLARREPWGYESPSGECYERICSVIGLYDFSSQDPDRLSFQKYEILEIVRQDESGWWGAVRCDGSEIGWIPSRYVRTLSDDAVQRVYEIQDRTRIPDYGADPEIVRSAPPLSRRAVEIPSPVFSDNESSDTAQARPVPSSRSDPSIVTEPYEPTISEIESLLRDSPPPPNTGFREIGDFPIPPSTIILPPIPQKSKSFLRLDKSLPASPDLTATSSSSFLEPKIGSHGRNCSESAISCSHGRAPRRPLIPCNPSSPGIVRAQASDQLATLVNPMDAPPPVTHHIPPNARPRPGKVLQLTGDDSAQAFHNAKQAQANLPWYLKHRHGEEEIKLDFDGTVKAGTLPALVEHLVVDPLRES